MSDPTTFTLAGSLDTPMVPVDSDPSILPWQAIRSYRLHYGQGMNFAAAWVLPVSSPTAIVHRWKAACVGPGETSMPETSFPTAEEAKAAVEQHVLDNIDIDQIEENR